MFFNNTKTAHKKTGNESCETAAFRGLSAE